MQDYVWNAGSDTFELGVTQEEVINTLAARQFDGKIQQFTPIFAWA